MNSVVSATQNVREIDCLVPEGLIHREVQYIEIGVLVWTSESRQSETMKKL